MSGIEVPGAWSGEVGDRELVPSLEMGEMGLAWATLGSRRVSDMAKGLARRSDIRVCNTSPAVFSLDSRVCKNKFPSAFSDNSTLSTKAVDGTLYISKFVIKG